MDEQPKKSLKKTYSLISEAKAIIEELLREHQGGLDGMSENAQATERGETLQDLVSDLDRIRDKLENVSEAIGDIVESTPDYS
jgi:methyl-accepting chemotaxis protein